MVVPEPEPEPEIDVWVFETEKDINLSIQKKNSKVENNVVVSLITVP